MTIPHISAIQHTSVKQEISSKTSSFEMFEKKISSIIQENTLQFLPVLSKTLIKTFLLIFITVWFYWFSAISFAIWFTELYERDLSLIATLLLFLKSFVIAFIMSPLFAAESIIYYITSAIEILMENPTYFHIFLKNLLEEIRWGINNLLSFFFYFFWTIYYIIINIINELFDIPNIENLIVG